MKKDEIYVETTIQAEIDDLWEYTQNPHLHEQWDIRFSSITYKEKQEGGPQTFTYTRTLGLGLSISGWGESVGNHTKRDGTKSSSLHFGTDQKISPIKEGRGYWQYIPNEETKQVTFLTAYNYDVNYGKLGQLFDALMFKQLFGWGTALSFDVLKRWLEKRETPKNQYTRFFFTYGLSLFFTCIWLYHGLIPKIIAKQPEELRMTGHIFRVNQTQLEVILVIIGLGEIAFALLWLLYPNKRQLFAFQCIAFPILMTSALVVDASNATHPFSPVTFNLALVVLSIIGFIVSKDVPTAKHCIRKRQKA